MAADAQTNGVGKLNEQMQADMVGELLCLGIKTEADRLLQLLQRYEQYKNDCIARSLTWVADDKPM
jgi:hypothetical protein